MPPAEPTPEERLFAVIQGTHQSGARAKGRTLSLAGVSSAASALIGPLDLPRVNRMLMGVVIALSALCLASPVMMRPQIGRVLRRAQQQVGPFAIAPPLEGLKPTEEAVKLMHDQDPFRLEAKMATAPPHVEETPPTPPTPSPKDVIIAKLKLVGISLNPEPVAMIEESSTKQTYVLIPGQKIGDATVKEILPDRIILRVGDEDVPLF